MAVFLMAVVLDFIIGDPPWLWHPVRTIGSAISKIENLLRKFCLKALHEFFAGLALTIVIVLGVYLFGYLIVNSKEFLQMVYLDWFYPGIVICLTASCIAYRELIRSGEFVLKHLQVEDIWGARKALGMIVGRDTSMLDEKGICKAVIETVSENLSDGVVAPIFYLVIGGLPLALAYKAINTLDSMIGYRNYRYEYFGKAAARLDDFANYIPARITGFVIAFVSAIYYKNLNSFKIMFRDGRKHFSPNSGIPEAAAAGALGVQIGGPAFYGGILVNKPFIGDAVESDYRKSAENMLRLACAVHIFYVIFTCIVLGIMDGTLTRLMQLVSV